MADTQYIVSTPVPTPRHSHLHIVYNRVRYDAKLVRSHNERDPATLRSAVRRQAAVRPDVALRRQEKRKDRTAAWSPIR
ncbi:MAG: relaxase/mobilization nuclease domain-containing protein [Alistipes indistinctus]